MTSFPLIRLVDAPSVDAAVLYDFNATYPSATTETFADGFTIGTPQLLGDVDAPGVQWGNRVLQFEHLVKGSKPGALSVQAVLASVLRRRRVWVMFQLDLGVAPVFFYARQSQHGSVSFDEVWVTDDDGFETQRPDRWTVGVDLTADSFGYGLRRSLPTVSATAAAPSVALAAVAGDAPCGLRVGVHQTDSGGTTLGNGFRVAVVASRDDADPVPVVNLADAAYTSGSDTTISGGRRVATFAAAGVPSEADPRVSGSVSSVPPGDYTAFVRTRGGVTTTPARRLHTMLQVAGVRSLPQTHSLPAGVVSQWLDLGRVSVGRSLPADLPQGAQPGPLRFWAGSDVTAWSLSFDSLLLLPAGDERRTTTTLCSVASPDVVTGATLTVDADDASAWVTGTDGQVAGSGALSGGVPVADPAAGRNTLVVLAGSRTVGPGGDATEALDPTSSGAAYSVTVSGHPRVVWLGDGQPSLLAAGTP